MRIASEVVVILGCYAIGCFSPGYWLVRWRTGEDIRRRHSGRTGARNVGRMLGRRGFAVTFALDAAKGALAVGLAAVLGLDGWSLAAAAVAVVVGHIWPAPLRFRGGRGLSPAFGAALALQPPAALGALLVAAVTLALTRRVNAAGLIAVAAAPFVAVVAGAPASRLAGVAALAALVLYAHRGMIRDMLGRRPPLTDVDAPGAAGSTDGTEPGAAAVPRGPMR